MNFRLNFSIFDGVLCSIIIHSHKTVSCNLKTGTNDKSYLTSLTGNEKCQERPD